MNYKMLLIGLLAFSGLSAKHRPGSCSVYNNYDDVESSVAQKYARSMLPGIALGLLTGALSGALVHDDTSWFATLCMWLAEAKVRESVVKYLKHDYDDAGLSYHKDLLKDTALTSSWIAYLMMRGYFNSSSYHAVCEPGLISITI